MQKAHSNLGFQESYQDDSLLNLTHYSFELVNLELESDSHQKLYVQFVAVAAKTFVVANTSPMDQQAPQHPCTLVHTHQAHPHLEQPQTFQQNLVLPDLD